MTNMIELDLNRASQLYHFRIVQKCSLVPSTIPIIFNFILRLLNILWLRFWESYKIGLYVHSENRSLFKKFSSVTSKQRCVMKTSVNILFCQPKLCDKYQTCLGGMSAREITLTWYDGINFGNSIPVRTGRFTFCMLFVLTFLLTN